VARFADRNRFASWTGTAPLDASSGEQIRHRLSRAGWPENEPHAAHRRSVQTRHNTEGHAYYRRKLDAGKTSRRPCAAWNDDSPTWPAVASLPTPDARSVDVRGQVDRAGFLVAPQRPPGLLSAQVGASSTGPGDAGVMAWSMEPDKTIPDARAALAVMFGMTMSCDKSTYRGTATRERRLLVVLAGSRLNSPCRE